MITYIYCITNILNGHRYIGKTTNDPSIRWKTHLRTAKRNRGFYLHAAIRHYSKENFTFEIVEKCDNVVGSEREQYWIALWNTTIDGYNLTDGGEGCAGYTHTESTKQKMKDHHWSKTKTYIPIRQTTSEETRRKISNSLKETWKIVVHPAIGRIVSENTCAKLRISKLGQKLTSETKQKISKKNTGKIRSDEARRNYSVSKSGSNNPAFGKPSPRRKAVIQIDPVGKIRIYSSIKEATKITGCAVKECCNKRYKQSRGSIWMTLKEFIGSRSILSSFRVLAKNQPKLYVPILL